MQNIVSQGTLVSSTNKTDGHDVAEILLQVMLNTISLTLTNANNKTINMMKIRIQI